MRQNWSHASLPLDFIQRLTNHFHGWLTQFLNSIISTSPLFDSNPINSSPSSSHKSPYSRSSPTNNFLKHFKTRALPWFHPICLSLTVSLTNRGTEGTLPPFHAIPASSHPEPLTTLQPSCLTVRRPFSIIRWSAAATDRGIYNGTERDSS